MSLGGIGDRSYKMNLKVQFGTHTLVVLTIALLFILALTLNCSTSNSTTGRDEQTAVTSTTFADATTPTSVLTPLPTSELDDYAMKMAVIAGNDTQDTRKRFRFVLSKIVDRCPSIGGPERAGDMLVVAHQHIEKIGLSGEERLLDTTNNLHSIISSASANDVFSRSSASHELTRSIKESDCHALSSMYVTLRAEGFSSADAKESVIAIIESIHTLGQ